MDILRKISLLIMLTYVAACGGGDTITQNAQIVQTTAGWSDRLRRTVGFATKRTTAAALARQSSRAGGQ